MKNNSAYIGLALAFVGLAGLGLNLHAQPKGAAAAASTASLAVPTGIKAEDVDLLGIVGDELLAACKPGANCTQSWQALGQLADRNAR
ncbi:MAG TPA: hypothetical protein VN028_01420 [Rhodocyclaceae bacterium]|nr:hypothetical protein [Rhodocyclaceae bacterium]